MIYILVILLILGGILGYIIEKNIFNFLTIFNILWATILFLVSFELFEINNISNKTYVIVAIGCFCYNLGYFIFNLKPVKVYLNDKTKNRKRKISDKFFIFCVIITLIWIAIAFKIVLLLLNGTPYRVIRDIYSGKSEVDALFTIKYIKTISKLIVVPSVYVIMVEIIKSLVTKKYSRKYYIVSALMLMLYCFVSGSRIIILIILLQMLFLFGFNKININYSRINKKVKSNIRKIILLLFLIIVAITFLRTNNNSRNKSQLMPYYAYGTVTMPLLDYWIDYVDSNKIQLYGASVSNGIITILKIFRVPLINAFNYSMDIITYCSNTFVPMFGDNTYNAFLSIFFYFYIDFNIIGVCIGSLIFGWISSYVYYNARISKNDYWINVALLFFIAIIKSFARFEFAQYDYIMMFVINAFLYKTQKNNNLGDKNEE